MKYRIQLRNVQNVAASKTALIQLPLGPRYHFIGFEHGYASGTNTIAAAATNVSQIRLMANEKAQRTMTGTELRDGNLLYGTTYDYVGLPNTAPGVAFGIHLAEPWRDDEVDQDALAWASSQFASFQLQIDLSTASTPTLTAFAVVDDVVPTKQVGIVKWIRASYPAGGSSFDIATLDKKDFVQQISIYPDSGGSNAPTQVTLRRNSVVLHELTNTQNKLLLQNYQMTPAASGRTASVYDVVLDHDGLLNSAIDMRDAARGGNTTDVSLTIAAASAMSGTTTYIVQRLGLPE
jgi:hypothetical protein